MIAWFLFFLVCTPISRREKCFQRWPLFFLQTEKKKKLEKQKKNRAPQVASSRLVSDPLFFFFLSSFFFRNIARGDLHSSCYLSGKFSQGVTRSSWRAPPSWLHLDHMLMNSFCVCVCAWISIDCFFCETFVRHQGNEKLAQVCNFRFRVFTNQKKNVEVFF